MSSDQAKILSQKPNSGIVQMPGRQFPGIVMQGDTISILFDQAVNALHDARTRRNEEMYYQFLDFAEVLQGQLSHYEDTLFSLGMPLPYSCSIKDRMVTNDFND